MSSDATEIHKLEDVVDLGKFLQARRARVNPADVGCRTTSGAGCRGCGGRSWRCSPG